MAILEGDLVGLSGKLGDHIYYQRNGKTYVRRASNKSYRESSPKQKVSQRKMKSAISLYRVIKTTSLYMVWRIAAKSSNRTGYNYFVSSNCNCFNEKGLVNDYGMLTISKGELALPALLQCEVTSKNSFRMTWIYNENDFSGSPDDRIYLFMLYDDNTFRNFYFDDLPFTRSGGFAEIELPDEDKHPVHLYSFFGSKNKDNFSCSKYLEIKWNDNEVQFGILNPSI